MVNFGGTKVNAPSAIAATVLLIVLYTAAWHKASCKTGECDAVVEPSTVEPPALSAGSHKQPPLAATQDQADLQEQRRKRTQELTHVDMPYQPPSSKNSTFQSEHGVRRTRETQDTDVQYTAVGCRRVSVQMIARRPTRMDNLTPAMCARHCFKEAAPFFVLTGGNVCGCLATEQDNLDIDPSRCQLPCEGDQAQECGGRGWWCSMHKITTPLKDTIAIYVAPAKRISSFFLSHRFMQYVSGQYEYPVRALNHALAKSEQAFYEEVCVQQPGKKVFVQVEGAVEFLLTHFPENSVLILVANELGNWGLTHKDRAIGPHGPGQPFETSEDGHIILPPQIMPYFRQYYSQQIWDAWGDDVRFFPLGSRQEFPQPDPATLKPASQRGYVYGYMVSFTDEGRRVLYNILRSDTTIPEHKVRAAGV